MTEAMVKVWDPLVRILHWALALAFFVAYFTGEGALAAHIAAGYIVLVIVGFRAIWGFVGPKTARFTDFVYKPETVMNYLRDLLSLKGKRYIGHSPAGGAMIVLLLVLLAVTCLTGIGVDTGRHSKATAVGSSSGIIATAYAEGEESGEHSRFGLMGDLHNALGGICFFVVLVHIGGVLLASYVHRENLARSMVTGMKREE